MFILYLIIILLAIVILLLSWAINHLLKKTIYLSDKEKQFIVFTFDVYENYADDLGIQSKEEHEKLKNELIKIKEKHLKI